MSEELKQDAVLLLEAALEFKPVEPQLIMLFNRATNFSKTWVEWNQTQNHTKQTVVEIFDANPGTNVIQAALDYAKACQANRSGGAWPQPETDNLKASAVAFQEYERNRKLGSGEVF